MFLLKNKQPSLQFVGPSEERRLIRELESSVLENAYLLGLLSDYSLRGLLQMGWGRFYRYGNWNPCDGLFYLDATGLLIPIRGTEASVIDFLKAVIRDRLHVSRIIASERWALPMEQAFARAPEASKKVRQRFPEIGMVLNPDRFASHVEPSLRPARSSDARAIALASTAAMLEELNVRTEGKDFDRLLSSKRDLITRGRYYLLEAEGRLIFQTYLSAFTKEVSQIQGVYVPPSERGRGTATRCVSELCRRFLEKTDRIVLRVQKRNLPAIAVYRKVGFVPFMDYLSVWYETGEGKGT